jgi:hypothetical protein
VNISLENYNTSSVAGHLIKDMKQILPFSTIILNVIRIPETIRFIIVQAHTFQYNVTLSYNAVLAPHSFINGTNLGLVQLINKNQNNAKFYIQNRNARPNISVLMTVQGYAEGGEFSYCSCYYVRRYHWTLCLIGIDQNWIWYVSFVFPFWHIIYVYLFGC